MPDIDADRSAYDIVGYDMELGDCLVFQAMIVHGARATLLIGLFASAVATLIGVGVGATAGYFGGWIDEIAMRAFEEPRAR